jgi:hypothetical protein
MRELPKNLVRKVEQAKLEHDPELVDRLVAGAFAGDPLADSLLAAFKSMPGGAGWEMLDRALLRGADAVPGGPPQLAELVAPVFSPPEWVDLDLVDAGALAFWRSGGINLGLALMCGSLAYGYQSARLTRPLAATGRLAQMAPRRLRETWRWISATTKPGALRPGAEGLRATMRLRMVHALVRAHLRDSPGWDLGAWGVPISASDTLFVAIGSFLVGSLRALEDLGVRFSPAEREAMTHQWAWIGALMGIPKELLPASYAEARGTLNVALALDEGPDEDSSRLMHALLHHGVDFPFERQLPRLARQPGRALKARLLGGFVRRWMDAGMADRLGVPNSVARLMPMLRLLTRAREAARARHLLDSDGRIASLELALVERIAMRGELEETIAPEEAERQPVLSVTGIGP